MTRLRVSQQALEGVQALLDLDGPDLLRIASALREQVPVKLVLDDEVASVVSECLPGAGAELADQLSGAVIGLHLMFSSSRRPMKTFVSDLIETLELDPDLQLVADVAAKITALLEIQSLKVSTKAWSLLEENDKIFTDARVVTDLRPVFGDEAVAPLAATVILHTLRIAYRTAGAGEGVFLVADDADLRALKNEIERALQKSEALRKLVKSYPDKAFGDSIGYGE